MNDTAKFEIIAFLILLVGIPAISLLIYGLITFPSTYRKMRLIVLAELAEAERELRRARDEQGRP